MSYAFYAVYVVTRTNPQLLLDMKPYKIKVFGITIISHPKETRRGHRKTRLVASLGASIMNVVSRILRSEADPL